MMTKHMTSDPSCYPPHHATRGDAPTLSAAAYSQSDASPKAPQDTT